MPAWVDGRVQFIDAETGRLKLHGVVDQSNPKIPPKPELEIQTIPEDSKGIAVREGIYKRIQAEVHPEDKEAEVMAEEMLEIPPEWNEVSDLMMEDGGVLPKAKGSTKRKRNSGRKMISDLRNMYIHPKYLEGHKIQRGSILNIGLKFSRKKTNGNCQISGRESYRWCFVAEI